MQGGAVAGNLMKSLRSAKCPSFLAYLSFSAEIDLGGVTTVTATATVTVTGVSFTLDRVGIRIFSLALFIFDYFLILGFFGIYLLLLLVAGWKAALQK